MENCQIPQEPYTERKDYITDIFNNIKILLSFASFRWFEHRIYDINECYTGKNNIAKRIAKEMSRPEFGDSDYGEEVVSYHLESGQFYAEAIPYGDRIMILPVSRLNINGDCQLLRQYEDSYDWISGNLKKDIICNSLEDAAYIICNDRNVKWKKNVKYI